MRECCAALVIDKVSSLIHLKWTLIERALASAGREAVILPAEDVSARFYDYQDGTHDWTYLLATQPCRIDGQVLLWIK